MHIPLNGDSLLSRLKATKGRYQRATEGSQAGLKQR